jgi:hypothetical protein
MLLYEKAWSNKLKFYQPKLFTYIIEIIVKLVVQQLGPPSWFTNFYKYPSNSPNLRIVIDTAAKLLSHQLVQMSNH